MAKTIYALIPAALLAFFLAATAEAAGDVLDDVAGQYVGTSPRGNACAVNVWERPGQVHPTPDELFVDVTQGNLWEHLDLPKNTELVFPVLPVRRQVTAYMYRADKRLELHFRGDRSLARVKIQVVKLVGDKRTTTIDCRKLRLR